MAFFGGSSVDLTSPGPIGSTTPNTGRFTTLTLAPSANTTPFTASGYSLTGTNAQSFFDLSGTWNTSGTPTAFKLNITDTASNASSLLMDLQVGGSSRFSFAKSGALTCNANVKASYFETSTASVIIDYSSGGVSLSSARQVGWANTTNAAFSQDVQLWRDAASVLALRTGTTAQTFRIYNTFTDASNYERGFMRWNTNVLEIGAEAAGTGTNRTVRISAYSTIDFYNTQYGYSMGSVAGGSWTFNAGAQITNVCRMDSNYGFQAASTRTFGWVSSTNTAVAPDTALYRNAAGVVEVNNGTAGTFRDLIVRNLRMSAPTLVPASASATGSEGQISWDASYIYVCTATNTWKRVAIATW